MRRRDRTWLGLVLWSVVALGSPRISMAADPPPWLKEAAQTVAPAMDPTMPAVTLLHEERVTVEDDGRVLTATRHATRILTRAGRSAAEAVELYRTDTGRVRDLRGWLIPPSGSAREYGRGDTADMALVDNDMYNEVRLKRIEASGEAEPRSVFGYESLSEDRAIFTQFEFHFQQTLPSMLSRFIVSVPNGWRVESVTFNHAPVQPVVTGSTYTWQLEILPHVDYEPASPELTSLVPRIAVSLFPPEGTRATTLRPFATWQDVSRWLSELNDSQVIVDGAVTAKAKSLTAGSTTDYDRISAIGRFVQGLQYVSIQTGTGRGGGYKPHTSAEVLAKAYGDCKDKANLMRAMLKAVGIVSYPVAIYSGDADYVRAEWPSPQQFNHAIVAVALPPGKQVSSMLSHPLLGPLMIFDPTDPETPVGELPGHEQGSLALIVAAERGGVARMPITAPESNRLERDVRATIGADGSVAATLRERSIGQAASDERREFRSMPRADYEKWIESWITRSVTGARVSNIAATDDQSDGTFTLQAEVTAPRYGQLMQNRLLIFKPAMVSRRASLFLTEPGRRYPIVIPSHVSSESARFKLPAGFQVDEIPDPVKLEATFGSYSAVHSVENGDLVFTRTLTLRRSILPTEQYPAIRGFYERILAAEQAPAVLMRK